MPLLREDVIHIAVRQHSRLNDWQLIAGQYPNGSDDELPPLNIVDPHLACDDSPDHRRHSKNKIVPDLVSCKGNVMLITEMKPGYSPQDESKLEHLIFAERPRLITALKALLASRRIQLRVPLEELTFVPALGFSESAPYKKNARFCYFKVKNLKEVLFEGNALVPAL